MKIMIKCIFFLFLVYGNLRAKYYFFDPSNNFGSDFYFNPLNSIVNGGFDILRNGGRKSRKDVSVIDFEAGFSNVFRCIKDPFPIIRNHKDGVDGFIESEIFPLSLKPKNANYFPNYVTHIVGNGFLFAKTAEWYDFYGYKYPEFLSFITTTSYQYLNEAIENGSSRVRNNTDAIADMLIFNPLGFLLFSFDGTKNFFSTKIRLSDWSLMPLYNPGNKFLENAGQQYMAKFNLPYLKENHLDGFFYWGSCGLFGLSYEYKHKHNISAGLGSIAYKILANENQDEASIIDDIIDPKMDGMIGLFYDINNSLISSVSVQFPKKPNVRINLYPGIFTGYFKELGLYTSFGEIDGFQVGLTSRFTPIGLIFGESNDK